MLEDSQMTPSKNTLCQRTLSTLNWKIYKPGTCFVWQTHNNMSKLNPLRSNPRNKHHLPMWVSISTRISFKLPQKMCVCSSFWSVCVCVLAGWKRGEERKLRQGSQSWKGSPGSLARGIAPWSRIRTRSNAELCTWEPPKKKETRLCMWVGGRSGGL